MIGMGSWCGTKISRRRSNLGALAVLAVWVSLLSGSIDSEWQIIKWQILLGWAGLGFFFSVLLGWRFRMEMS